MAHGDALEGKWRGNWRMEWVASTLHTNSEYGVSSITTADAHTSAASTRLNWRPRRFKWTRPLHRKTKSDFCACAITFQAQSTAQEAGTDDEGVSESGVKEDIWAQERKGKKLIKMPNEYSLLDGSVNNLMLARLQGRNL
jgi:hypothetical protein